MASDRTEKKVRTTVVFPEILDRNLNICSLKMDLSKNDVIKRALTEFIRAQGLEPDRAPKISVQYEKAR